VSTFISLGLGRYARADRILAVEPIDGDERGPGRRTRVWVEGLTQPIVASRSEAAILADLDVAVAEGPRDERPRRGRRGEEPPSLF
jgi:hypothetical protein